MHTGEFIRTVKFDKSMSGYKVSDVDTFLDEVADDVDKLIAENRALSQKLAEAKKGETAANKPVEVDNSDSIQNVQNILVSAQRFSDQIINEANEKAAAILSEANTKSKEIDEKVAAVLAAFEKDISERKTNADNEISKMLSAAAVKSEGIITAAHDSVARQQLLFDKLKLEVSEFKKHLFENHKQQLEILQKFPDMVPYDPERAAKALEFTVDSEPDFRAFIPNTGIKSEDFADNSDDQTANEAPEEISALPEEAPGSDAKISSENEAQHDAVAEDNINEDNINNAADNEKFEDKADKKAFAGFNIKRPDSTEK